MKGDLKQSFVLSLSVVAIHALAHAVFSGKLSGVWNPLVVTVAVAIFYYFLRDLTYVSQRKSLTFASVVSVAHFGAHYISSTALGLDIISASVIGIAGSVTFATVFVLEKFFD